MDGPVLLWRLLVDPTCSFFPYLKVLRLGLWHYHLHWFHALLGQAISEVLIESTGTFNFSFCDNMVGCQSSFRILRFREPTNPEYDHGQSQWSFLERDILVFHRMSLAQQYPQLYLSLLNQNRLTIYIHQGQVKYSPVLNLYSKF